MTNKRRSPPGKKLNDPAPQSVADLNELDDSMTKSDLIFVLEGMFRRTNTPQAVLLDRGVRDFIVDRLLKR